MLDDGRYDVVVVDAEEGSDGSLHLDLTILDGPHKGEVVAVRATGLQREALDLLAEPGVLLVADGAPRFTLDG